MRDTITMKEIDISKSRPHKRDDKIFAGASILIVDDDQYNLELLNILLKKWSIDVKIAEWGGDAINMVTNTIFDLILMDIQMPVMSGLETTSRLRKMGYDQVPIIAITAASTEEEIKACFEVGMNDYLVKPYKKKDLKAKISRYVGQQHQISTRDDEESFSLDNLSLLANGDDSFVVNMVNVYIENSSRDLARLEKYILASNWISAGKQAHKMIPPNRHLGISKLADVLEEIENKGVNEKELNTIPFLLDKAKQYSESAISKLTRERTRLITSE